MMVELVEITEDTLGAVLTLDVLPGQHGQVAPNAVSIAEAYFTPTAWFRSICADGRPVGFVMLEETPQEGVVWIWRLMIDARYQGQGYGAAAMHLVFERVRRMAGVHTLYVSFVDQDGGAGPFYRKLGFVDTGEVDEDGEVILKFALTVGDRETESRPPPHGWLLDEVARAGRENLDAEHAAHYDAKEDATAADEVALLQRFGLGSDSIVIDIGAGTGQFTLAAAPVCGKVIAVDVSPVMLAVLRRKVTASPFDNVEVIQAGFLTYQHAGEPADFVYSRFALHHLPDFWKALALQRMRACLRPQAVLRLSDVVYNFDAAEAGERLEAWCAAFDDQPAGGWTRADVEEHIRDEHSTFIWLLEPMIERAGFRIERADYSSDGVFAHYLARAI
jgi:SAM-dependent methyltransferase/GNAT superfamily N-acetyltransferase